MDELLIVDPDTAASRYRLRVLKDRLFGATMAVGGVGVIVAILMIFIYLLWVVAPLFASARMELASTYPTPLRGSAIAHLSVEEYGEIGFAIAEDGSYAFFDLADGQRRISGDIADVPLLIAGGDPVEAAVFAVRRDGEMLALAPAFEISYPNDARRIDPELTFPLGEDWIPVVRPGEAVNRFAAQLGDDQATVAVWTGDTLVLTTITREVSFLDDSVTVEASSQALDFPGDEAIFMAVDVDQRELFVTDAEGYLYYYDIYDRAAPELIDRSRAVEPDRTITAFEMLSGGISLLVGDSGGTVSQWFPVRDAANDYALARVRSLEAGAEPVIHITPEVFRKGYAVIDEAGTISLSHTTAERTVVRTNSSIDSVMAMAMAPRADWLVVADGQDRILRFEVANPHPEVSMSSLWGRVWYESRSGPEYIWQSSSASSDFEPKFSLTPLAFGTLKAAFYAMLFAVPLAIAGAIYTAYFMTPKMRGLVKPSIEIMEALPTVILGFLAGLWLAPLVERQLAGVFLILVGIPLAIVASSFLYYHLPRRYRGILGEGWEAALLLPVVCLTIWGAMTIGPLIEAWLFGGSLSGWLATEMGITYDQRNSLVVGMAMGFAVIPTIFSISEDAVFSVPRHLTTGSLALGATPWQTLTRVVLLTASPGIFSGVMIGLGRAVGETMIVLMATGNTPIMDVNIFQGFRALSANIAVEMPESEVGSTHYRILFLAALVLFLVTFAFNTVAEIVRQRLRRKYSSL